MQKTSSKAPRMKMKRMNDARQIRRAVWKYAVLKLFGLSYLSF